jgi:predicted transcriptional regulator of viral defense system
MNALTFLSQHPIFTFAEFREAFRDRNTPAAARAKLKYHLARGHVRPVARNLYAVVPPGASTPPTVDRFLVAAKLAPDSVIGYHSALELWGAAPTVAATVYYLTATSARPWAHQGVTYQPVAPPQALVAQGEAHWGVVELERAGTWVRVTSRERTFVDCLDRLAYAGGWEELCRSVENLPSLDFAALWQYLERRKKRTLCARVGFLLERYQEHFFVPEEFLERLSAGRPQSPTYFAGRRGRDASSPAGT